MPVIKLGLRSRIVGAILLTSAVTLGAAAIALLSPLERSLRDDEIAGLRQNALAARATFALLPRAAVAPRSPGLRRAAVGVSRRAEARVAILDASGRELYNLTQDPALLAIARSALARHRVVTRVQNEAGRSVAIVATPTRLSSAHGVIALRRSLQEAHSAVAVVRRALLVACLIALAVGVLLGAWLVTAQLRRLRRLRDAVRRVGERGLTSDIPIDGGRDEVADLTRAFRSMHAALRRQEESRKVFVATASHELRTPITSLHGMLELLDEDLSRPEPDLRDARFQLAGARRQSARLVALARDLLDLSRLDAETTLRSEPVELIEICRAVLAEFELAAGERGIELSLEHAVPSCWALADPGSVARIVRILVDNGLRYSPSDETVTVRVEQRPGPPARAAITVADRGPGVSRAECEQIFERFGRGSTARGDEAGFGLGLAIGRELARRMGGDLVLLDPGVPGARFEALLPVPSEPELEAESNQLTPGRAQG